MADEKHTWWLGERVYVATTAAAGWIFGVGVAETADAVALTQAYGEFQPEVHALNPDYAPQSLNTDGWEGTQSAWKSWFPGIKVMLGFLHPVQSIQQRCRRIPKFLAQLTEKLWHLYGSLNPHQEGQRLRRLQQWAAKQDVSATVSGENPGINPKSSSILTHLGNPTSVSY